MAEEPPNTLRYHILRYTPNLVRDEWVNIGVLLEEVGGARRALRMIEETSEIARVRRLHPNADEELLRGLPGEFQARLKDSEESVRAYLAKLGETLSNAVQLSPQKAVFAANFDAELDRLYHDHVAPPPRAGVGARVIESTRAWIKKRINDVLLRRRVPQLERNIRVEEFTQPGDTFKLDYGYRNGVRGYIQALALGRDVYQAKVLAYTTERIRARLPECEFTAVTEAEPSGSNTQHQFVARLFEDQGINVVPLSRIDKFAEELRVRLQ
ncbi:MAG: DUF3037 domain-containing protein [Candidatus Acidiferrales bacterium]